MTPAADDTPGERSTLHPSERYRKLVEVLPDAVLIHQDGHVRYANPAACALFRAADVGVLMDLPALDLVHPDCRAAASEAWGVVLTTGIAAAPIEEALLRLDGTTTVAELTVIPFEVDGRPAVLVVGKAHAADTPPLSGEERALAMEYSQHALDAMDAHVCVLDEDGTIVALNRAWRRFSTPNARATAGLGANYFAVCEAVSGPDASDARRSEAGIRSVMLGERREFVYEYGCDSPTERRWFEMHARRTVIRGRVHAVVAHTETTARRLAELALAEMEERLRQSQKLEAIGRLAGGVAHDFNNLVTVVNNHADFALAALPESHPVRTEVHQIRRAGDRAVALTRQLLAFSRRETPRPRAFDLNHVVADLRPMLGRLLGEDLDLVIDLDPAAGPIEADPHQLEQAIVNLAINARDAMPSGGTLRITTRRHRQDGTAGDGADGFIRLSIRDSGVGMDEATKSRIFEPFFTTKPAGQGTGLGLSTVFAVVQEAGGDITVDSSPGRGTVFQIDLPLSSSPVSAADAGSRQSGGGAESVLLVEDERTVREVARRILQAAGYRVFAPASATEAIAGVRDGGRFDLLVSDLVMPDMSGRDLAAQLYPFLPQLKVLYMSGYTPDLVAPQGASAPPASFLSKPFQAEELRRAVREALNGGMGE